MLITEYKEVRNNFVDDNGNISVDGWRTEDDNENGVCLAIINVDGVAIYSKHHKMSMDQPNVKEAIDEAIQTQKEIKLELIDKVIEEINNDINKGDTTAVIELLLKLNSEDLKAFMPETNL